MPVSRPRILRTAASVASHRAWIAVACAVALVLTAGSLRDGLSRDDFVHLHMVQADSDLITPAHVDMFRTDQGDRAVLSARMEKGVYPWFTDLQLRLGFFRPLASVTHAVDYSLFPGHPVWMHVQNLLWYAVLVAIAGALYRRVLGPHWVAGLACFLFAVDHAHGGAVGWIAGRNGLMAGAFGFAAVLLHDLATRDKHSVARVLSPIMLALALLSGELGLGAVAWLVAHALWLQRDCWRTRAIHLAPHLAVVFCWTVAWIGLGYGAQASGYYVDPRGDPLLFLRAVAWNTPGLVAMLFAPPPFAAATWASLSPLWLRVGTQAVAALLVGGSIALAVARDRNARFFATGTLLSVLGVCGTMPDGRLLLLASFGAMGLSAQVAGAALSRAHPAWGFRAARIPVALAALLLLTVFGVLSAIALPGATSLISKLHQAERRARRAAPLPDELSRRTVVLLNAPHAFVPAAWFLREDDGDPVPDKVRGLTFGPGSVLVHRQDDRTVVVTPLAGFLSEPVSWLYRRPGSFHSPGESIVLSDMTARVDALTRDGRPAVVSFSFEEPIDQTREVWLAWKAGQWVRFPVPAVGATVRWTD